MIRTWPFVVASCTGAFTYEAFSVNHAFYGGIAPHFALPGFGLLMLWVLLVRLVLDEEDCWLIPPPVALGQAGKQPLGVVVVSGQNTLENLRNAIRHLANLRPSALDGCGTC